MQMLRDSRLSVDRPEEFGWLAWVERALVRARDACQVKAKEEKARIRLRERSERAEVARLQGWC